MVPKRDESTTTYGAVPPIFMGHMVTIPPIKQKSLPGSTTTNMGATNDAT